MNKVQLETVDKNTLSKSLARRIGLAIYDAMQIINVVEDEIITAIKDNKKVQLNGFLTFTPRDVKGKTIISPLDKKEYTIPSKRVVDVRVGKLFKESIKDSYLKEDEKDDSTKKSKGTKKSK